MSNGSRHGVPALAAVLCLALSIAAMDRIGRHSGKGGSVLVLSRGDPGVALRALLARQDARVLHVWAEGRVVQLHTDSLRALQIPQAAAWAALRLPLQALALPACG